MSAANRPGLSTRTPHDFYATPTWCVRRLLDALAAAGRLPGSSLLEPCAGRLPGYSLLEPCAGDGAILRACRSWGLTAVWTAVDIRPECLDGLEAAVEPDGAAAIGDFLAAAPLASGEFDGILTNPPYVLAADFIRATRGAVECSYWLLRLNFLASEDRRALFSEVGVPDVFVLPNRPTFKRVWAQGKDGKWKLTTSDSTEYAWFGFPREARTAGSLSFLGVTSEEERAAARELAPVEDKDGRVLWALGTPCGACGGATRWKAGLVACVSCGHAALAGTV